MRQTKIPPWSFAVAFTLAGSTILVAAPGDNLVGRWSPQFNWPIIPIHATLLPNGKVFTFGTNNKGVQGAQFNYDVWNPALGVGNSSHQTLQNKTNTDIFCAATGLLPNGDVLIPGGDTRDPINEGIKDALIFQTASQNLARVDYMAFARWYPSLTTLPNGDLLIHGGREAKGQPIATPEIFAKGEWRSLWGASDHAITANDGARWFYPRNFVAPNGRIFGMTDNLMYFLDWEGEGGTEQVGQLPNKTRAHTSTAVMYRPGKIFQAGGSTNGDTNAPGSNQAISVDITSGKPIITNLPNMAFKRVWGNSTVLPNGEVLITGGSGVVNKLVDPAKTAEMWNPESKQFRRLSTAATARLYHSIALLLPDATVLVGGGGAPGPLTNLNAEIFYPPYLFDANGNLAPRSTLGNFNDQQNYGNTIAVPFSPSGAVKKVTLVRSGAVTHSFDMSQRFVELIFTAQEGSVTVKMPSSPNIAPPGFYMLFLINDKGVPSVGRIISLKQGGIVNTNPKPGGVYSLVSRLSGRCVDVENGGAEDGTRILQWDCHGGDNQKFRLQPAENGKFSLVNIQTKKCLDVSGPSVENGALVHQWTCHGRSNQLVSLTPGTQGSYQIRYEHSGRCMDVQKKDPNNGANIQQWGCSGGASNQEWYFKP